MPLFTVAILLHPSKKAQEEGEPEKLVFGPTNVVAKDPQGAAVAAMLGENAPKGLDVTRAEVLVRPF